MSEIHQIHDKFFKYSLKEKKIAIDLIRAVVPGAIVQRLDLLQLQLSDKSLVSKRLEEFHSDIIYRCPIDGKDGYIFFLIEHNSTANELMAFRKLEYIVLLMGQHLLEGHEKLPIIVPICLYHGKKSPYPYSTDIYDCFENPTLAQELVFKPFQLIDLTILSEDVLQQHGRAALMELLLKHYRRKDFIHVLKRLLEENWIEALIKELGDSYLEAVLHYIAYSGDGYRPESGQELVQIFVNALPSEQEVIMNIAERLKQDGRREGRQEGRQEARLETQQQIALNLRRKGYSMSAIAEITGLPQEQLETLLT